MSNSIFKTWSEDDQDMEVRHQRHWQHLIDLIEEPILNGLTVLDFGCNQGGFLRALYARKPFLAGVGVDIVEQSVAVGESRKGNLPLSYEVTTTPEHHTNKFDVAFSNAVIYLIEDLNNHAKIIKTMLKPGGVYYVTHSEYQLGDELESMQARINAYSPMPMHNHTLSQIAQAFINSGFSVGVQLFRADGFISIDREQLRTKEVIDKVRHASAQKHIFRMRSPIKV